MFQLFDKVSDVKMQIQKKRRGNNFGGMWGSHINFWDKGQHPSNQGDGWGNQGNQGGGWGNQGNNQGNQGDGWGSNQGNTGVWGQLGGMNQSLGNIGLEMALFGNKGMWGNNVEGNSWVSEQLNRQSFEMMNPSMAGFNLGEIKNVLEKQIIFLEPSPAEKKIQELMQQGKTFYDERFPPNEVSLTGGQRSPEWAQIQWKRVSEAMPSAQVFTGKIEPDDIKQGYLGDCYFLAGLAALAERPDRIFSLFLTTEVNPVKYYSVKILYKGKWMTIDMDEYIPFMHGKPAFTKAKDNQLWVMLLEKAWAKLYKSYKQIEAGYAEEALHDLTGAPIKHIYFRQSTFNAQEEWNYLIMASQKQYSMVASSAPGSDSDQSSSGIVQGHAYTFLNATVLQYRGGQDRVVQLRNPWGKGQSKGKWSDNDPNWNNVSEQQKRRVGFCKSATDGIFFMTYQDFISEFRALAVAEINDNASYIYKSMKDRQKNGVFFRIEIVQRGHYSFQIDKTPERDFSEAIQNKYRYPNATIELGRLNGNKCQKLGKFSSTRRTTSKGYDLEPGQYIAYVKVDFDNRFEKQFDINLAVYAEYACDIEVASRNQAIALTNNPNLNWNPQQHQQGQHQWNHMGNSAYHGNSGWGNNQGGNDGWGNNQPKKDDGWGNQGGNGWGGNQGGNDGWGNNQPKKDDGWGNQGGNQGGWGNNQPKKDDGWGNQGGNQGWGGNQGGNDGWGNNPPKKDDGWGIQGGNDGWGNNPPKKDDGWGGNQPQQGGNQGGNTGWGMNQGNNGWGNIPPGNNSGPQKSWGPGW